MKEDTSIDIASFLRAVPDFPKPGIIFRDISPLLAAPKIFRYVVDEMARRISSHSVDAIVGIESRGFIFAAPLAIELGVPLVMVRKPGKLPGVVESVQYGLEYGTDALQLQRGALSQANSVIVVDDVLASGGTAQAVSTLVEQVGAHVRGYIFLAELEALGGRSRLAGASVEALVRM
jgi:adenine phosphoribosyltransferase